MAGLLIGQLAERTGMPAPTILYYESLGVMRRPARSASGYRRYSDDAIRDLTFISKAQALGFSLEEIAEILKLSRSGKAPCERVLSIAHQHLTALEERIRQLQTFRSQLGSGTQKMGWEDQNHDSRGDQLDDSRPDHHAGHLLHANCGRFAGVGSESGQSQRQEV